MEKLLNEETTWDKDTSCGKVENPCELFVHDEILKALRTLNTSTASGPTGVVMEVSQMFSVRHRSCVVISVVNYCCCR